MSDETKLIEDALTRATAFACEADKLTEADILGIAQRVHPLGRSGESLGEELHAIAALLTRLQGRLIEQAGAEANRLGWLVGKYLIAPVAHTSEERAVTWITGNAYMPPLRDLWPSEHVWQVSATADLWSSYSEGVERALDQERVYMAAPEYDNALYVVDLRRFESVEEPEDAESLEDEWRPIPNE